MRWGMLLLLFGIATGTVFAQQAVPLLKQQAGNYTVTLLNMYYPNQPRTGQDDVLVSLAEGAEQLNGAEVKVDYGLKGAAQLTPATVTAGAVPCDFHVKVKFDAPGEYTLRVTVHRQPGATQPGDGQATFTMNVLARQTPAAPSVTLPKPATPLAAITENRIWVQVAVAGALLVILGAAVIYRLRKK